jgi:hypothetical protein
MTRLMRATSESSRLDGESQGSFQLIFPPVTYVFDGSAILVAF